MGYEIYLRERNFTVKKENFVPLVQVVREKFPALFDSMDSLRVVFKEFDFSVEADENGDLVDLEFPGGRAGNEDEFFAAIAPFVEPGSYLCFEGEDNAIWINRFDGKQCMEERPLLIFPNSPKPLKEGQAVYRLPFSIQGDIEIPAVSLEDAYKVLERFDSEDFLSCLLALFQENGIGCYLRPAEMKKMEGSTDAAL